MIWRALTDFGDLAVLLPVVFGAAAWLALTGHAKTALALSASVGFAIGATVVLKLLFMSGVVALAGIHSPSGHTSVSVAAYGDLAVLLALSLSGWRKWALLAASLALAIAIACSRVILDLHTIGDVIFGFAMGLIAAGLFVWRLRGRSVSLEHPEALLAILIAIALLMHGWQFPSSDILKHLLRK
jgi:membrane-associated phospholipid phosphatase